MSGRGRKRPGAPGGFVMIPSSLFSAKGRERPLNRKNEAALTPDEFLLLALVLRRGPHKIDGRQDYGGVEGARTVPYSLVKKVFGWSDRRIRDRFKSLERKRYLDREPGVRIGRRAAPHQYWIGPAHPWAPGHDRLASGRADRLAPGQADKPSSTARPLARRQDGKEWYKGRTRKRDRRDSPTDSNGDDQLARVQEDLDSPSTRRNGGPGASESGPADPSAVKWADGVPVGVPAGGTVMSPTRHGSGGWWLRVDSPGSRCEWLGPYRTRQAAQDARRGASAKPAPAASVAEAS